MRLEELARSVHTLDDLVRFLRAVVDDFAANGDQWTNAELTGFLEAMVAWSDDMDGYYSNIGVDISKVPPWRVFADIIMAARVYE